MNEYFPNEWKKANIIPIHKKGDKQIIKNYRSVLLLPICGKIFEKIKSFDLSPSLEVRGAFFGTYRKILTELGVIKRLRIEAATGGDPLKKVFLKNS